MGLCQTELIQFPHELAVYVYLAQAEIRRLCADLEASDVPEARAAPMVSAPALHKQGLWLPAHETWSMMEVIAGPEEELVEWFALVVLIGFRTVLGRQ